MTACSVVSCISRTWLPPCWSYCRLPPRALSDLECTQSTVLPSPCQTFVTWRDSRKRLTVSWIFLASHSWPCPVPCKKVLLALQIIGEHLLLSPLVCFCSMLVMLAIFLVVMNPVGGYWSTVLAMCFSSTLKWKFWLSQLPGTTPHHLHLWICFYLRQYMLLTALLCFLQLCQLYLGLHSSSVHLTDVHWPLLDADLLHVYKLHVDCTGDCLILPSMMSSISCYHSGLWPLVLSLISHKHNIYSVSLLMNLLPSCLASLHHPAPEKKHEFALCASTRTWHYPPVPKLWACLCTWLSKWMVRGVHPAQACH